MIKSMNELKKKAINVYEGMETRFPQFDVQEKLHVSELNPENNKMRYSYNNGVVAFIDEDGEFWTIPDIRGVQAVLTEAGFKRGYFYVPFSNWDYPVSYENKWKELWKEKNSKI